MKGTTYSGIVYFPEHPDADMHGLVRIVCRERSAIEVLRRLASAGFCCAGLMHSKLLQESKSHVEQQAAERCYGELLVCSLVSQYLDPELYRPVTSELLRRRTKTCNTDPKVRSGVVAQDFLERQRKSSSDA